MNILDSDFIKDDRSDSQNKLSLIIRYAVIGFVLATDLKQSVELLIGNNKKLDGLFNELNIIALLSILVILYYTYENYARTKKEKENIYIISDSVRHSSQYILISLFMIYTYYRKINFYLQSKGWNFTSVSFVVMSIFIFYLLSREIAFLRRRL